MKLIEHLIRPERLLILWQAPDPQTGHALGRRFVIGEIFSHSEQIYLQYYNTQDIQDAVNQFNFKGLTAYPYEAGKTYGNVEEALSKRFASPNRSDYLEYLHSYRLPADKIGQLTTMQMLAYTGGVLTGDGFSFVPDFENTKAPFDFTLEIAGFRHNEGMLLPALIKLMDEEIRFACEPENEHDPDAVAIFYHQTKLGYIPRGLATYFKKNVLNSYQTKSFICKVNGTAERPKITVLTQVR